jgi:hypothetical protein
MDAFQDRKMVVSTVSDYVCGDPGGAFVKAWVSYLGFCCPIQGDQVIRGF